MTKWNALQKERTTEASLLADLFQEADAIVVGKKTSRYIPVARTPSKFHHSKKKFKSLEILTMERS